MPIIKLNDRSIKDVTSLPFGVGNLVHIQSQTASNSASISFTTGINSTYKEYQFYFINVGARTNGTELLFQGSTDGGSNYGVTITSTLFRAYNRENDSGAGLAYVTNSDLAQSTSFQPLIQTTTLGGNADDCLGGTMSLFNPASTTYVKHFISTVSAVETGNWTSYVAGYFNTTSALNAVQFKMGTGNMDGTIAMFGVL